jgi:hypothetical protein
MILCFSDCFHAGLQTKSREAYTELKSRYGKTCTLATVASVRDGDNIRRIPMFPERADS